MEVVGVTVAVLLSSVVSVVAVVVAVVVVLDLDVIVSVDRKDVRSYEVESTFSFWPLDER